MREKISDADNSLLNLLHIEYDTVFLEKSLAGTHVRARTGPISWPVSTATDTPHALGTNEPQERASRCQTNSPNLADSEVMTIHRNAMPGM